LLSGSQTLKQGAGLPPKTPNDVVRSAAASPALGKNGRQFRTGEGADNGRFT